MPGDGKMNFKPVAPYNSGFYARGNARDMVLITVNNLKTIVVANNSGPIDLFQLKTSE